MAIEEIFRARNDFRSCSELLEPDEQERWCECFDTALFGENENKKSIEFLRNMRAPETAQMIKNIHLSLNTMVALFQKSLWWKDSDG